MKLRTVAVLPVALLALLRVAGHGGEDAGRAVTARERLVKEGKCGCENPSCKGKANPVCNGPKINCSCGTGGRAGGSGPERDGETSCCCPPAADPQK